MTTKALIAKAKEDLAKHKCYGGKRMSEYCGICQYLDALDRWLARSTK